MMSSATYFKLYGCIYGVYYNKLDKKYNVERFDNMEDANAFMELKATDRHRFIHGRKLTDRRTVTIRYTLRICSYFCYSLIFCEIVEICGVVNFILTFREFLLYS